MGLFRSLHRAARRPAALGGAAKWLHKPASAAADAAQGGPAKPRRHGFAGFGR